MSTRVEVTKALASIIREALPNVPWSVNISGANATKGIEGTISCDHVSFEQGARCFVLARATYTVYVIDMQGNAPIEEIGDTLFDVLNCSDLNGACMVCNVNSIVYGAPKGNQKASALLMELVAEYEV